MIKEKTSKEKTSKEIILFIIDEENTKQMLHNALYHEEIEKEADILKALYDSWKFDEENNIKRI